MWGTEQWLDLSLPERFCCRPFPELSSAQAAAASCKRALGAGGVSVPMTDGQPEVGAVVCTVDLCAGTALLGSTSWPTAPREWPGSKHRCQKAAGCTEAPW